MTISGEFKGLIQRAVDLDRRMAKRTGKHLDRSFALINEIKEQGGQTTQKALPAQPFPPATKNELTHLIKKDLIDLARGYEIQGRTKAIRSKGKDALIVLLLEHKVPALTFKSLLTFYLNSVKS